MITYPVIFFGAAQGPLREDFEEYSAGALPNYGQIWQYHAHGWLVPKNPNKYVGFTYKDFGISGANDSFDDWGVGSVSLTNPKTFKGDGNFEIWDWSGFSAGFFRDPKGVFTSADEIRGYQYVNFDWGTQPPVNAYKADFWSARFIAKLTLPMDGTYQFYVERDEACRIWIGRENGPNTLIFNQWGTPPPGVKEVSSQFTYTAGDIDIFIEYYDDTGLAKLKLYWVKPDHPGGGPSGPPVIIGPGDFGVSGWHYFYGTPEPFRQDFGYESLYMNGVYRLGVIKADPIRDDATWMAYDLSGSYRLGISYADPVRVDIGQTQVNPVGYHVYKAQHAQLAEYGQNVLDPRGFYAYRSAFATANEPVSDKINILNSYYIYKAATSDARDYGKTTVNPQGFYAYGRSTTDPLIDQGLNWMYPEGYYLPLHLPHGESDQGGNYTNFDGNYVALYVYGNWQDYAANNLLPSGYYITGYVNTDDPRDIGRVNFKTSGHYAYYLVTGDRYQDDFASNMIGTEYAFYAYKNALPYEAEPAKNNLGFEYALYFPRYLYLPTKENNYNVIDAEGAYYPRYVYQDYTDYSTVNVKPSGYYITGYVNNYNVEPADVYINPAGHYVSGQNQVSYREFSANILKPVGNYFLGILPNYTHEDVAFNSIGLDSGYYRGIYVYQRYQEPAYNKIDPQGLYYWNRKPQYQFDTAYDQLRFDGIYFNRYSYQYNFDPSFVSVNTSGYYITGYIYLNQREYIKNTLNTAGNYFYRYLYSQGADTVSGNLGMDGVYFYRYLYSQTTEPVSGLIDMQGLYFGRYCYNQITESVTGNIDPKGNYYWKYALTREAEPAKNLLGFEYALYYPVHPPFRWDDQAFDKIDMQGEIFYGRVPRQYQEPSFNILAYDGVYRNRFVPAERPRDYSWAYLMFAGEYTKEAWTTIDSSVIEINFASEFVSYYEVTQELVSLSASVSGAYTAARVSTTLDYWLEIYQRPTYNMGKSQSYFSI